MREKKVALCRQRLINRVRGQSPNAFNNSSVISKSVGLKLFVPDTSPVEFICHVNNLVGESFSGVHM